MKKLWILFLFLPLSLWAKPEFIKETNMPNGLKVHEYRLSNGMQILLVPDHSAPVFTYQVWFHVGSATEKLDPKLHRTGLAHLFEHMMFRGTPKNPDQVFDAKISEAGAVGNNATTWLDRTNYFESLPKDRLELIFSLESDRMVNLALDDKLFKTELGAVFGELKMNEDKPMRVANRLLWDLAFDQHPYKWTTMGTPDELNSFKVEDAQYFYKTYYAPNNATLLLIGDLSIPKALNLAEKYYGKIPSQIIPKREANLDPPIQKARLKEATHPLLNSKIILIGYRSPDLNHKDIAPLEVLASHIAYGNGSVLEQDLVQSGISSSMFASVYRLKYPGLFVIGTQIAPGKDDKQAIKIIESALDDVKKGKLSANELERSKNQLLLQSYGEIQDFDGIGDVLGESLVSSGNYLRGLEILEETKKVSAADLQRVAKKYLDSNTSSTVILSPMEKAQSAEKGKK